jgi:hypothetical protein
MSASPDFSANILARFYGRDKLLRVTLFSGEVLTGIFVGFFRGDPQKNETYIVTWRFVNEPYISDYKLSPEKYMEFGRKIQQSEISTVNFK